MHEPIREHIEAYLAGSDELPVEFMAHLKSCDSCREEAGALKLHAEMLRMLRAPVEADPRPGFYARVVERIDSQRQSSIWSLFLEPAFGRRLALASATLAVLMGLYLFSSEPGLNGSIAETRRDFVFLGGEDQVAPMLGVHGREQDRGIILVDLVSFQE
jgi:hypothetical protein